jgi:hypothetical protein
MFESIRSVRAGIGSLPRWVWAIVCFLILGTISTLLSPWFSMIREKATFQVVGITLELFAALSMALAARSHPSELTALTRLLSIVMGMLASVGILQFATSNILGYELINFEGMNDVAGGFVWASPGAMGALARSNSFCSEPAHFGIMLGIATGPALLRAGFFGQELKRVMKPSVPGWAAITILIGLLVSLSLVAYFDLLAITLSLAWLFRQHAPGRVIRLIGSLLLVFSGFFAIAYLVIPEIGEKMATIDLIPIAFGKDRVSSSVDDLSALTLAANLEVARENLLSNVLLGGGLGSHPVVYDLVAPEYAMLTLNSENAASLLIRLISETGLLGTIVFLGGCLAVIRDSRRTLMIGMQIGGFPKIEHICAIGLTASFSGTLVTYLVRMGTYYDPSFWVILGLVASVSLDRSRATAQEVGKTTAAPHFNVKSKAC